jgi:hypothetical protein
MAREEQFEELEEQEGQASDGLGTALVVITSLIMVVAFIIVEMALKEYGRGLFAK